MVPRLSPADSPTAEHKQLRVGKLDLFPQLSDAEFVEACSTLLQKFDRLGCRQTEWSAVESVSQSGATYLRITKPLAWPSQLPGASDDNEEIELREEEDDEVAEMGNSSRTVVHYDVVLSPSYRVPVLYLSISDTLHRYPLTMETLYSVIIPSAFKAQAKNVGVIGGVTITVGLSGKPETFPS